MHYVKGAFIFDLVATSAWPLLELLKTQSYPADSIKLIYLLRLFRISNILILMNLQIFTGHVRDYYRKNLIKTILAKRDIQEDQTVDNNKIMQQIFLIKFYQVFRLIIFILILSYFLGTMWFIMTMYTTYNDDQFTFYNAYGLKYLEDMENLTIVVYFVFTTLTTVGLGDFNPKSEIERGVMTFVLLIGVACFSFVMSQFIDILLKV